MNFEWWQQLAKWWPLPTETEKIKRDKIPPASKQQEHIVKILLHPPVRATVVLMIAF